MKRPQFTIRDLLLSTAIIAVGFCLLGVFGSVLTPTLRVEGGVTIVERRFGALSFYAGTLGLLGGLALIFGGMLYPFGKSRLGMVFGVVLGVLLYAGYWALLWYYYHP